MTTVDTIQGRIAAMVDQDENTSNISATDYSKRLNYINRAQMEWAEVWPWQVLYKEFNTLTSTSTGNATITMPSNFRKLSSYPKITYDGTTTAQFPDVLPQEDGQYTNTDKRILCYGNAVEGYSYVVRGATMVSGASIMVPYIATPTSLASPANNVECPNADFLVQRTIAYLWEAQEDPRFQQAKADSAQILSNMIEFEETISRASTNDRIKTTDEVKNNFRWGID